MPLNSESDLPQIPAPWELTGTGYILAFKFPRNFVMQHGFIPPTLTDRYNGGFGAMMMVDYHTSNAGPYRELLFIPGKFRYGPHSYYSITKIFVSTPASVHNGRQNWGIPKELADFEVHTEDQTDRFIIRRGDHVIADFTLQHYGINIPVTTSLVPGDFRTYLHPTPDGHMLLTTPGGSGMMRPARLVRANVTPACFPDPAGGHLITAVQAANFTLRFPVAQTAPAEEGQSA